MQLRLSRLYPLSMPTAHAPHQSNLDRMSRGLEKAIFYCSSPHVLHQCLLPLKSVPGCPTCVKKAVQASCGYIIVDPQGLNVGQSHMASLPRKRKGSCPRAKKHDQPGPLAVIEIADPTHRTRLFDFMSLVHFHAFEYTQSALDCRLFRSKRRWTLEIGKPCPPHRGHPAYRC